MGVSVGGRGLGVEVGPQRGEVKPGGPAAFTWAANRRNNSYTRGLSAWYFLNRSAHSGDSPPDGSGEGVGVILHLTRRGQAGEQPAGVGRRAWAMSPAM
jgi:hypothetical protein